MRGRAFAGRPAVALAAGLLVSALCLIHATGAEASETLTGLVLSSNRVLLEGAVVALEGFGSVHTDAKGQFTFPDVPSGNYRLTVSKQGFPDEKRLIRVQDGRPNRAVIFLAGTAPPSPQGTIFVVPIVHLGSSIFVRVRVNEQVETLFLVDTGATLCVLTKAAADRLALTPSLLSTTVKLVTASGSIEVPLIQVDLIQVGGAEARGVGAVIHDLSGFPPTVGGILGLSFLNQFKVVIASEEGVMLLSR